VYGQREAVALGHVISSRNASNDWFGKGCRGLDRTIFMQRRTLFRVLIGGAFGTLGLPAQEAYGQEWIISTIYDAAGRHGVSGDWLLNTAICESQLDPWAYNEMTGDIGLFQFKPSTWTEWGADPSAIWDVWSQADMAAWAFSAGLHTHWCCSGTWQGEQCVWQ
jgi:hypothetical protein